MLEIFFRSLSIWWQPIYQSVLDDPNRMYLYVLGESTAEGVQYQEKISPARLVSFQFNDSLQGKPIEILEIAESGTTIEYNYFEFLFETLFRPHRNALVLIYSGINEGIANSTDPDFKSWEQKQHSIVLSKLNYMFGRYANSPAKYQYRYEQVIALAQKHHYKTVVSQLVGNICGYDPEVYAQDIILQKEQRQALDTAELFFEEKKYVEAEQGYRAVLTKAGYEHPFLLYRIACCKEKTQQYDSAKIYFDRLPEISGYIGYAHWKNEILSEVANQKDVALAKTFDRFVDSSEHGLVGYNLINDAHHPNLRGYCIMSREYAREISVLYHEPIKRAISEDIVKREFGFDEAFMNGVYFKQVEWFIYETLETKMRTNRLRRLLYYKEKYKAINPTDETVLLWEPIVAIITKDEPSFISCIQKIEKSERKQEFIQRLQDGFGTGTYRDEFRETIGRFVLKEETDSAFVKELLKGFI